jgi:hypothetical protein
MVDHANYSHDYIVGEPSITHVKCSGTNMCHITIPNKKGEFMGLDLGTSTNAYALIHLPLTTRPRVPHGL